MEESQKSEVFKTSLNHFVDGAISGFITGAFMQPLQVIKTSMQVSPIEKPTDHDPQASKAMQKILVKSKRQHYELLGFRQATQLLYQREGIMGFYRGFIPSILKNILNSGTYFSTLFYLKQTLHMMELMSEHKENFVASALARCVQSTLCNPLIVIKTRLEVMGFGEYDNLVDAIRKIKKVEGLGGFFTGLKISLIRDVPFSGIFFPLYEYSKSLYAILLNIDPSTEESKKRVFQLALLSSSASLTANLLSCIITHPLDIIRTRVFFQFYNKDQTQHYNGLLQAIKQIYQFDGVIGYFRGITPRIIRKGLGNIIAWTIYEYLVDKRTGYAIKLD